MVHTLDYLFFLITSNIIETDFIYIMTHNKCYMWDIYHIISYKMFQNALHVRLVLASFKMDLSNNRLNGSETVQGKDIEKPWFRFN